MDASVMQIVDATLQRPIQLFELFNALVDARVDASDDVTVDATCQCGFALIRRIMRQWRDVIHGLVDAIIDATAQSMRLMRLSMLCSMRSTQLCVRCNRG